MLCLKKYFTEGLIQLTILLSLIGVQVDVDTYLSSQLPPLREIILGPDSAYAQTQFHNLRNTLDGYGVHPKSVDLDYFFTSRRLLNRVRSLDRLRVPSAELSAWLVHRDPEAGVSSSPQSAPSIALDSGGSGGLDDASQPEGSAMRAEGGTRPESGHGPSGVENLGAVAPWGGQGQHEPSGSRDDEDIDWIDALWQQDTDLGTGREVFGHCSQRKEAEAEKRAPGHNEEGPELEGWGHDLFLQEGETQAPGEGETAERASEQLSSPGALSSPSLEECLQLLESSFPFGEQSEYHGAVTPELTEPSEESFSVSQGLTFLPQNEVPLDLEQQWQDIMAIMELQDMEVNSTAGNSFISSRPDSSSGLDSGTFTNLINQNVSLHQASLPSCYQELPPVFSPNLDTAGPCRPTQFSLLSCNSSSVNSTFRANNLTGLFLPTALNGTNNISSIPSLPEALNSLLEEAMLDEISLLDLAMEEGFSQEQFCQLEDELDSDSGLSLDFSHSPPSPCTSNTSCSSDTSSSTCFSEEGAVGYSTNSEEAENEGGAVGGLQPKHNFCRMSYQDPSQLHQLPQLEHVGHNHTYNLSPSSKLSCSENALPPDDKHISRDARGRLAPSPSGSDLSDKQSGRDERRARAMKIPFSIDCIINLPVNEFNDLLAKHCLSEAQLTLIRDIRRRGKNKMAAQNCRKRKLDTILGLEQSVESLRRNKARLLKEKEEFLRCIRHMKRKVHTLHQEVSSLLRDQNGRPYPPSEYTLQFGSDGSVLVVPRHLAANQACKPDKKQKSKKK
ncbi:hypothetical protein GJAV_G00152260 [Gymnothorax javanicus]|nr:hypothetical protein GJAV_G00152260 [Gymnothorax javanicus]